MDARGQAHRTETNRTSLRLAAALTTLVCAAAAATAADTGNDACFECHEDPELESTNAAGDTLPAFVDRTLYAASAHGQHRCTSCHTDVTDPDHPDDLQPVDCASCHRLETEMYADSDHGRALAAGERGAASCKDCHGHHHSIVSARDPGSPVHRRNQAATCGSCHTHNPSIRVSVAEPVLTYAATVHGRALLERDNEAAATCTDCHGSHDLHSAGNPQSRVYKTRIPETCGACHRNEKEIFNRSVHGVDLQQGILDVPACTDCHGEHTILGHEDPASTVFATTISRTTCPQCHAAQRITSKFDIPRLRVQSYMTTYHGLASQLGVTTVANCASCHGVHDILPSSDPRSTINPANLGTTCARCHPGASAIMLANIKVHAVDEAGRARPAALVAAIYLVLIPLVIGGMLAHHGIDFCRKLAAHARFQLRARGGALRWTRFERVEHVCLLISFVALAYSGFVIRFPTTWWAAPFRAIGGETFRSGFHRTFAVIFCAVAVVHLLHALLAPRGRRFVRGMRPAVEDLRAVQRFVTGRAATVPEPDAPGRFSYIAKAEYWALVWGSWVMILTGLALAFNNWALAHLPAWAIEVAGEIHFYEAVLAGLAILVWHIYRTIFDPLIYPLDLAFLSGRPPLLTTDARSPGPPERGVSAPPPHRASPEAS